MTENTPSTNQTPALTTAPISTPITTIELLGKPYQVRCEQEKVPLLQKAADYLNEVMQAMPTAGKLLAPEKLALMAALNLASQLQELEQQMSQHIHALNQRLGHLQAKLETALSSTQIMELESAAQI